ncbi:hypothetical protein [Streptomyces sp. YIM S03343]
MHHLPHPARGRVEIVIDRSPDGTTQLTYFLDGFKVSAATLGVTEYLVDPGASDASREWQEGMEAIARGATPAAAAELRHLVADYA